jgi:Rrf2 family protein
MLSKKAKYAINALVYLAQQPQNEPVQIRTISETENISRKFLESILLVLRNAGMVNSKKGKDGGYYLSLSAEEINMAEVMRIFDGPIALLPCVTHKYYQKCQECKDEIHCGIRDVFSDVRRETVRMLKDATLAEIVLRQKKLYEMDAETTLPQ